jgi:hypothetical protein
MKTRFIISAIIILLVILYLMKVKFDYNNEIKNIKKTDYIILNGGLESFFYQNGNYPKTKADIKSFISENEYIKVFNCLLHHDSLLFVTDNGVFRIIAIRNYRKENLVPIHDLSFLKHLLVRNNIILFETKALTICQAKDYFAFKNGKSIKTIYKEDSHDFIIENRSLIDSCFFLRNKSFDTIYLKFDFTKKNICCITIPCDNKQDIKNRELILDDISGTWHQRFDSFFYQLYFVYDENPPRTDSLRNNFYNR